MCLRAGLLIVSSGLSLIVVGTQPLTWHGYMPGYLDSYNIIPLAKKRNSDFVSIKGKGFPRAEILLKPGSDYRLIASLIKQQWDATSQKERSKYAVDLIRYLSKLGAKPSEKKFWNENWTRTPDLPNFIFLFLTDLSFEYSLSQSFQNEVKSDSQVRGFLGSVLVNPTGLLTNTVIPDELRLPLLQENQKAADARLLAKKLMLKETPTETEMMFAYMAFMRTDGSVSSMDPKEAHRVALAFSKRLPKSALAHYLLMYSAMDIDDRQLVRESAQKALSLGISPLYRENKAKQYRTY